MKTLYTPKVYAILIHVMLMMALVNTTFAQTNTFNDAMADNLWSTAGNWSLGHSPLLAEDVVIAARKICAVDGNYSCNSVSLTAPTGFTAGTTELWIIDGFTLTVTGNVTVNGGNADTRQSFIYICDGSIPSAATLTVGGSLKINTSGNIRGIVDMTNGAGILNIAGNFELTNATPRGTLNSSTTSTVNFNGTVAQTMAIGDGTGSYCNIAYNDINITNTSAAVSIATGNENIATAGCVGGNITVPVNATFDNGGKAITGNAGKTFQVDNGGTFKLTGSTSLSTFPTGFGTITLGATSTVNYAATGTGANAQTIGAANYGHLTSSSTGDRILASSGTIGIAGTFTPGTNTYTITGSTIDFNGTGAQTVPAFNYQNLTVSGARTTNSVTYINGGTIGVAGTFTPSATFTTGGNVLTNNTMSFNGTSAQVINSTAAFTYTNLTINNAAGVSINAASAMQKVTGTLAKTSGTLTTNSLLTLVSNASGDARIDGGGGTVSGNVVVQRYTSNNGYPGNRMFGAPTTNATVQNVKDALVNYNSSIYFYTEATSSYAAAAGGNSILPSKGITAYIKGADLPATISFNGPINAGTIDFSGSGNITTAGATYTGYNLVSNPYPSQIDWASGAGWTKTNIGVAMYVWDCTLNDYRGWSTATGAINGGSNVIASGQGFWIVAAAGHDFQCTEAVKTTGGGFYKTNQVSNSLRLKVTDSTNTKYYDDAIIRFDQKATTKSELFTFDAKRLYSSTSLIPNLSTLSSDSINLAANTYPALDKKYTIPVVLKVNKTGTYTISAKDITLPSSTCIMLEDVKTGAQIDIKNTNYTFTMAQGSSNAPRFLIHFTPGVVTAAIQPSCNGNKDGKAVVGGQANGPWSYEWKDAKGTIIKTTVNTNTSDTISGLSNGTYYVKITNTSGYCTTTIDSVIVNEPDVLSANIIATNISCNGTNDGSATLTTSGGSAPYSFAWSNSATTETINNLSTGNYSVTVVDKNNCSTTANITIAISATKADFTANTDTVYLSNGGNMLFKNVSTGATNYLWDFGDGSPTSTIANPTHTYSKAGVYTVKLTTDNGSCTDNITHQITVLTTGMNEESALEKQINIINQHDGVLIQFNFPTMQNVNLKIYNVLAQRVWETTNLKVKNNSLPINLNNYSSGIYLINFEMEGKVISKKFNFTK